MTRTLLQHFGCDEFGESEEAAEVERQNRSVIVVGIVGERLGDEDAGIVDQRVDAAEAFERLRDDALRRLGIGDVAGEQPGHRDPRTA